MKVALLIYEAKETFEERVGEKSSAYWGAWSAYIAALNQAGVVVGGQGLQEPQRATTVRLKDGATLVQDGPCADTKEQLAGFFLLDVPSLDEAIAWASRCPAMATGAVEIRPILDA